MCWPTNHIRPTPDTQPRSCQAQIEGMPNHQVEGSFGSPDAVLPITAPGPAARVNEDRERPDLRREAADQAELRTSLLLAESSARSRGGRDRHAVAGIPPFSRSGVATASSF